MLFSLIDPFDGAHYRSKHLTRMVQWANELGASRFQIVDDEGKFICHVNKSDGQWLTSDPQYQTCALMTGVDPLEGGV